MIPSWPRIVGNILRNDEASSPEAAQPKTYTDGEYQNGHHKTPESGILMRTDWPYESPSDK
jgi:hypothetical protein